MSTHLAKSKRLPIVMMMILGVFASLPLLRHAHAAATSITIANNSSREIRHVYLAAANGDNWGPDQLNGAIAAGGGSITLDNVSCSGAGVKVVAEDQNGCFLYHVVSCNDSVTWAITNDAVPDCGN
ncbi:MAG TPA: hypothetical protein VIW64_14455 [Pyrinomonadaceae bacterium]|jgi:hypothetical protein